MQDGSKSNVYSPQDSSQEEVQLVRIVLNRAARLTIAGVAGTLALAAVDARAQGSGIQLTPDASRYLISKDVGTERWAISFNLSDRTVTGNVFKTDGSPPSFIWCDITQETPAPNPADNQYLLDCYGANACAQAPCSDTDWTLIASGLPIGGDFLLPDGTTSTLSGNVQPIFTQTCAISLACHQQGGAGILNLQAGAAYASTVGVTTAQSGAAGKPLVDPFGIDSSYLYDKVTGEGVATPMPLGGPPIPPDQMDTIRNWILEGAVNN
jgi:hypothetical protein